MREVLREVYRVTARKGGAVYRTEYVEDRWVPMGSESPDPDLVYSPKPLAFEGQTIRRRTVAK